MPRPRSISPDDPDYARKLAVREAASRNYAKMREMTRLEQAAVKERALLGTDKSPYLPREQKEVEAIRSLIAELEERAKTLNATVEWRLDREAERDAGKKALLARFRSMKGQRLELPAF